MSDANCEIISSKPVLSAKLFDVNQLTIQFANGNTAVHHVVDRHPTVCVLPLTEKYEVYFVKQYRYLLQKVTLELMAGFINEKESPLAAAKRELTEETGIQAIQWEELVTADISASVIAAKVHVFLARDLTFGTPHPDDDEEITLVKLSLDEAVKKILTGEITTSATILAILLADKLRKDKKI